MLVDVHPQRRKRGRATSGPAAARAPASVRRPPRPSTPSQPSLLPPVPIAASTRILAALPRFPETQRAPPPVPLWTRRAGSPLATSGGGDEDISSSSATGDVQRLIRHAHRARALLLDRLAVVSLRRSHRCALAEELARLKKVLVATQAEVDASTRDIATMDRLVLHLQSISSIFDAGVTQQHVESCSSAGDAAAVAGDEDEEKPAALLLLQTDGGGDGRVTTSPTDVAAPELGTGSRRHKRRSEALDDDDDDLEDDSHPAPSENEPFNARCGGAS